MGMTEHYIEIRSKCCGVRKKYDDFEQWKIEISLAICGCDDPRYVFDSFVMNRTYVVPKAVELYYRKNLIICMDLSDVQFRGKETESKKKICFLEGGTVECRIPTEYHNKQIDILFICVEPDFTDFPLEEPVVINKNEDCCICRKPLAEAKEKKCKQSICVKEHSFHEACLNMRWLDSLSRQKNHKDKDKFCPLCHYFKNPRVYYRGGHENSLEEFCIEYIIYNKIKTSTLPSTLQDKIREKMSMIKPKDSDLDSDYDSDSDSDSDD